MERENQEYISIVNATENNLKHVSLKIPKKKITVFTGVSGSGKSSLCLDTIAAESRRELNVTFPSFVQQFLPKYGRPEVERMENLPVTIVIDQKKPVANSRSTVGTYTDIYALLRLLFSRVGKPFVGYSDSFSFNHPSGKCERCEGLGVVTELDIHKLVDFDKCLNDEALSSGRRSRPVHGGGSGTRTAVCLIWTRRSRIIRRRRWIYFSIRRRSA